MSATRLPAPTPAEIAAQKTQAAHDERLAEVKVAVLGVTKIRNAVANRDTLRLTRVTVRPTGTICYRFHLTNSHGHTYQRTAALEDALLKVSGSDGFAALWNNRCADKTAGRDITTDVQAQIQASAPQSRLHHESISA